MSDLVERLRDIISGQGEVLVCRHPDLEESGAAIDDPDRTCVLDIGRQKDCDIALYEKFSNKAKCPYWQNALRVQPRGLTIEESAEAIAEITRLTEELARTERNREMWKDQCERQAGELARYRKIAGDLAGAVEPFVRHGRALGAFGEDGGPFWIMTDEGHRDVPVADFEGARTALSSYREMGE